MISFLEKSQPMTPSQLGDDPYDFEIVFGRKQAASTALLVLVMLVVVCGVAYMAGKAAGPTKTVIVEAAGPAPVAATPAPVPVMSTLPVVQKSIGTSAPIFGEQLQGKVYLQVGAVDKGLAGIWAEGLRAHNLDAFVAPGPSEKMWRVVIGPLPDPAAFQRAKDTLDSLGINTFGRKQQ